MKYRRIIIPLAIFVISLSISGYAAFKFRHNISRVVNTAKENGWPIIVANSVNENFKLAVYTLEGPGALLVTESTRKDIYGYFFDDEGILHYLTYDPEIRYFVELPDYRPNPNFKKLDLLPSGYKQSLGNIVNFGMFQWDLPSSNRDLELNPLRITNAMTGKSTEIIFDIDPPWLTSSMDLRQLNHAWTNQETLFVLETVSNPESATSDGRMLRTGSLWRYEIASGEWTHIYDTGHWPEIYIGPEGNTVGISFNVGNHSRVTYFIDGVSGDILHTVDNSLTPYVGKRWVACFSWTDGDRIVILLDMENDWEKHDIHLLRGKYFLHQLGGIALYEP